MSEHTNRQLGTDVEVGADRTHHGLPTSTPKLLRLRRVVVEGGAAVAAEGDVPLAVGGGGDADAVAGAAVVAADVRGERRPPADGPNGLRDRAADDDDADQTGGAR